MSRKFVSTLSKCKKFASSKKALAFNYGFQADLPRNKKVCQALQCPELHNFSTFIHNRNYNYYSMYPNYILPETGTLVCVPKTGVFLFSSTNLNYTQAQEKCKKLNGSLAHVISEERTDGLAKFLPLNTPVFVGLSNQDHENIWTNEFDEPLDCFEYRAWGIGEPSNSKGCAALVRTSSVSFWKVLPCRRTMRFVCEIFPIYHSRKQP